MKVSNHIIHPSDMCTCMHACMAVCSEELVHADVCVRGSLSEVWVFRDVVFQDLGPQTTSCKPFTQISPRCEVRTPSVVEGRHTIMFKPQILEHHIPELPNNCFFARGCQRLTAQAPQAYDVYMYMYVYRYRYRYTCVHTYICVYVYIYIYIYTHMCTCMCIYIYIYMLCVYIYIYI